MYIQNAPMIVTTSVKVKGDLIATNDGYLVSYGEFTSSQISMITRYCTGPGNLVFWSFNVHW